MKTGILIFLVLFYAKHKHIIYYSATSRLKKCDIIGILMFHHESSIVRWYVNAMQLCTIL